MHSGPLRQQRTVRLVTIVSVNRMSDGLSLELKGNLVRECVCVHVCVCLVLSWQWASELKAHSPVVKLHSGCDASKSPRLLSAVIHAGEAGYRHQGRPGLAQDKSPTLDRNCQGKMAFHKVTDKVSVQTQHCRVALIWIRTHSQENTDNNLTAIASLG